MTQTLKLKHRLLYFLGIGTGAALLHVFTVFHLVSYLKLPILIANLFAFLIAFNVSFFGHKYLTFAKLHDEKTLSLRHFFLVAASSAIINELLYSLLLDYTSLNYLIALILVLAVVAIYSFILSRFWACR